MLMTLRFIICFVKLYFMFFAPYPFSEKKGFSFFWQGGRGTILQSPVGHYFMLFLCFAGYQILIYHKLEHIFRIKLSILMIFGLNPAI